MGNVQGKKDILKNGIYYIFFLGVEEEKRNCIGASSPHIREHKTS